MNSPQTIRQYSMHGSTGFVVLHEKWIDWVLSHTPENNYGMGSITHHSWYVGDEYIEVANENWYFAFVLPDLLGFIAFEQNRWEPDNCLLLDAYGKERMRLTVPWELTGSTNPESAKPPTSFDNISGPYVNPADGKRGEFGVTAWVACAGKYYFELDYRTGQFLWCVGIRD